MSWPQPGSTKEKQMKTYTIDTENSITAHASNHEADDGHSFGSQQELATLVAEWPANRLIEVWNGIPGLTPVKKFTNRKSAVSRIWKAIQSLDGGATEEATTATERANKPEAGAKASKKTTAAKKAPKGKKAAKAQETAGSRE